MLAGAPVFTGDAGAPRQAPCGGSRRRKNASRGRFKLKVLLPGGPRTRPPRKFESPRTIEGHRVRGFPLEVRVMNRATEELLRD